MTDQSTYVGNANFPGDPKRYPTATESQVTEMDVPPYTSTADDNSFLTDNGYATDAELRDNPSQEYPTREFDYFLRRFFTAYVKDTIQPGYAVPLSGAGTGYLGATPAAPIPFIGGPGILYGFSLVNFNTAAPVTIAILRQSDNAIIRTIQVPAAVSATQPGVYNDNVGTNGSYFAAPGLSYYATAQFSGVAMIQKTINL